jgi:predicted metal-dependent phosphoesterase TrpH
MVRLGYVKTAAEAFKNYLGSGKAGDVKNCWPSLETVVGWIVQSGGTAVIAHPRKYKMTLTKLRMLIADFKAHGGQGIEVCGSGQKQGEIGLLTELCQRFDLLGSVGSDFHSARFGWCDLGRIAPLPASVKPVWNGW